MDGLVADLRSTLSCVSACGRIAHQSCMGNFSSVPQRTDTKWSLNTWIAFSAAFLRWSLGGTSWYFISLAVIAFLKSAEHSLSRMWIVGRCSLSRSLSKMRLYAWIIVPDVRLRIGSAKMLPEMLMSYATMTYWFPLNDCDGNLPV